MLASNFSCLAPRRCLVDGHAHACGISTRWGATTMPPVTHAVGAKLGNHQPRARPTDAASARHEKTIRLAAIRARDASGGSRVRAFCALLRIAWSEYEHD